MRSALHPLLPLLPTTGKFLSLLCCFYSHLAPKSRTGWNDPRASPRSNFDTLPRQNDNRRSGAFATGPLSSPRARGGGGSEWSVRSSSNGWTPREPRGDGHQETPGSGVWRNGVHVIGSRNMRLEKDLFGDPNDPSKQHTGINFEKYDDIPVEATGAGVPDPVTAFTNPPLDPVLLENIALAHYSTPTPVQKYSIPIVAANRDLMACAQVSTFVILWSVSLMSSLDWFRQNSRFPLPYSLGVFRLWTLSGSSRDSPDGLLSHT